MGCWSFPLLRTWGQGPTGKGPVSHVGPSDPPGTDKKAYPSWRSRNISVWPGSETPAWLSQEISCVWDFLWESPNCFVGLNIPHGAVGIAVDSQLHSAKQNQRFGKITALDALAGTTRTSSLLMARKEKKLAGAAEQEGLLVSAECGALLERETEHHELALANQMVAPYKAVALSFWTKLGPSVLQCHVLISTCKCWLAVCLGWPCPLKSWTSSDWGILLPGTLRNTGLRVPELSDLKRDAERHSDFCLPAWNWPEISVSENFSFTSWLKSSSIWSFLNILNVYHSSCFFSLTLTPMNLAHICGYR